MDLDPQGTAATWGTLRDADTPVATNAPAHRLAPVLRAAQALGVEAFERLLDE